MINSNNLIIITTSLPNNEISMKRKNNLINKFSNFKIIFNEGIIDKTRKFYQTLKNALETFKNTNSEFAIICDDDFSPIDNFLDELNKTVQLLPSNWRCLHLCPGYLWGRKFRDKTKIGSLNAEYNMDKIPFHESGRFYKSCDSNKYFRNKFWLGGPIAFLVNKNSINSLLNDYVAQYQKNKFNNDVILTKILNNDDFICREPILGFEEEQGGASVKICTIL
jgi:hypothetical protein